jgi:hypothetical protein
MTDVKTKALAREMRAMVTQPEVKRNVRRVAEKLTAFKVTTSGEVVRQKPTTSSSRRRSA